MIRIKNAKAYINGKFENKDIYINNGKISFSGDVNCENVDASGKMILPGFIDIHIHGAMGCDFNDGTEEAIDTIAEFTASHGTTCMLATTSTVGSEVLK